MITNIQIIVNTEKNCIRFIPTERLMKNHHVTNYYMMIFHLAYDGPYHLWLKIYFVRISILSNNPNEFGPSFSCCTVLSKLVNKLSITKLQMFFYYRK